ncbi:MAG: HAD family hydrolase [Sphingomonas bacterium]|nr:HAD family hydrolase [Sphingomonas bacterium]
MPISLICLDADDTLWQNMRHFNEAEAAFVALLAPFADANIARKALEACETRNLPLYGYGAKSFTLSLIETAVELAPGEIDAGMVQDILAAGRRLLAHPVELLNDIEATLDLLASRARLILVTKGDLLHQEAKLAASGLGDRFSGVEIVSDKRVATFERIFQTYGVAPQEALMAGDSMRSDILPALGAGAWAAHIPQGGAWSHEHADAPDSARFRALERLADLPAWVDSIA